MANAYTTFPDSVQRFDLKTDVSSSVYDDWKQFNTYIANGQFANATNLLQSNTELQKCIVDSVYVNQLTKTVEEVQDLFLNNIQTYIHETIVNRGEWNATTKYVKYNFVTYSINGIVQTFECLRDDTPIATLPTNTTYWIPRVIQGEKGAPGLGLTPRGIWNSNALYLVNDFVAHNNSFWQCITQNSNNEPTDANTSWLQLIDLSVMLNDLSSDISDISTDISELSQTIQNNNAEVASDIASISNSITSVTNNVNTLTTSINDVSTRLTNHDVQINTANGAHGFRYYQNLLQYKNGTAWTTIQIGSGGSHVGTTAPSDTKLLWIDTGNGGIVKYHNGTSWVTTKAVWG